jgi:hypothetical protein
VCRDVVLQASHDTSPFHRKIVGARGLGQLNSEDVTQYRSIIGAL